MVLITPSSAQVFSPFGSFVVERHDECTDFHLGRDEREHSGASVGRPTTFEWNDTLKAA